MLDKNYLLELTDRLYQLTLLFPKKDPVRNSMRELANEILSGLVLYTAMSKEADGGFQGQEDRINIIYKIEVLNSFFELARRQNWVKGDYILNLQSEYSKLKSDLEKQQSFGFPVIQLPQRSQRAKEEITTSSPILERHQKILAILKEKGRAQVWQLKQIFPEVSKRTLRRDFEQLLSEGLIERIGERNETFYQLKAGNNEVGHTYSI